jgi:hypothetical protein
LLLKHYAHPRSWITPMPFLLPNEIQATSWGRIFLNKLPVPTLIKKFPGKCSRYNDYATGWMVRRLNPGGSEIFFSSQNIPEQLRVPGF